MSRDDAGRIAGRWRRAEPKSFGGEQHFEAEIIQMVPKDWWKHPEVIVTVRVRYPEPSLVEGVDDWPQPEVTE